MKPVVERPQARFLQVLPPQKMQRKGRWEDEEEPGAEGAAWREVDGPLLAVTMELLVEEEGRG